MPSSPRRWLLPEMLRAGVLLIDSACLGAAGLAWVGRYATTTLFTSLGAVFVVATLLALLPGRRADPTARTLAAVVAVSPPPAGRILGRSTMVLRLNHFDGTPRQFVHVDPHTPVALWPEEGARVIVELVRSRKPKVVVLWHLGVVYLEPAEGVRDVDDRGVPVPAGLSEHELETLPALELVELVNVHEPSPLARRYLFPTEKFRGEWRRHWIRWVKELLVGGLVAVGVLVAYGDRGGLVVDFRHPHLGDFVGLPGIQFADLVALVVWFAWVAYRGLTWLNNRVVLTNRRVMHIKGLFWRRVASVPLAKAADVLHSKSPLGAILGYGTFRFNNVPWLRPLWRVADLPHPRDIYLQIMGETFEADGAAARPYDPHAVDPHALEDHGLDELVAAQFIG